MVIFFYGEDTYRLKQAVKKVKEKFISASLGDTNLAILDGKTIEYNEIVRQILAIPFLSRSRLVIIENLISEGKKEVQEKVGEVLKKVPSTTVLLFSETNPDKRTALFKKLTKVDKVQEFAPLDEIKIRSWIKKELELRSANYEEGVISKLVEYCGNDLWRLSNELDKLTAYRLQTTERQTDNGKQTTAKNTSVDGSRSSVGVSDIDLLVKNQEESDIFRMIDALGQKNYKSAMKELDRLEKNGEADLYILTMIVFQFRNLLIVKDMEGNSQWDIVKKSGLKPFVVGKCLQLIKRFTFTELKNIYKTLLDFDYKIKVGKIDSKTALVLLLAKLTANDQLSRTQ